MSHRYVWPACKGKQQSVLTLAVDCFCRLNTDSCCFRAGRDWFGRRMATSTWGCNGQCIHSVWNTHIYISRCEYTYIFGVYQTTLGCSDHGGSNLSTEGYAICCLRIRNDMFEHNLVLCMYHTGWLCPTTAFSTSCDNTCNSSVYASIVGVFSLVMIQSSTMVTAGLMHV